MKLRVYTENPGVIGEPWKPHPPPLPFLKRSALVQHLEAFFVTMKHLHIYLLLVDKLLAVLLYLHCTPSTSTAWIDFLTRVISSCPRNACTYYMPSVLGPGGLQKKDGRSEDRMFKAWYVALGFSNFVSLL